MPQWVRNIWHYPFPSLTVIFTLLLAIKSGLSLYESCLQYLQSRDTLSEVGLAVISFGLAILALIFLALSIRQAVLNLRRGQRNVYALDWLVLPKSRVTYQDSQDYAELVFDMHGPVIQDRKLTTIRERFCKWYKANNCVFKLFRRIDENGVNERIIGGFWLVGLERNVYERFRDDHRNVDELMDSTVPMDSERCYALQPVAVVADDTYEQFQTDKFITSHVVLSNLFSEISRLCEKYPHIEKVGSLHHKSHVTFMNRIFGFKDRGDIKKERRFAERCAKGFPDQPPEPCPTN